MRPSLTPSRLWSVLLAATMVAFLALGAGPGAAQTSSDTTTLAQNGNGIDYAAWETVATRAENLIEAGGASTAFFTNLRGTLADWRARLIEAQDTNAERIETIEGQIDALGPVPGDGSAEPDAIAERRTTLTDQLAQAQAPRLNAAEATERAEGLIREIDALLRDRQQRELLELDPTPLNPVNWPTAFSDLGNALSALEEEFARQVADGTRRAAAIDNLPLLALLTIFGAVALLRGRRWTQRLTERLQANAHLRGGAAVAFIVSLSQLVVPLIGVMSILAAVVYSGLIGANGLLLVEALAALILAALGGLWLGGRLFPSGQGPLGLMDLEPEQKIKARRTLAMIGAIYGLGTVIQALSGLNEISPAGRGVLTLPVYVLMALAFWRLSALLKTGRKVQAVEEAPGFSRGMVAIVEKALLVVAVVGAVLALIGYTNAAEALMLPSAQTLAILGVVIALQPVIRDIHALVFRTTQEAASEALLPILINFVLVFGAVPLVALTWGMRPETLSDVYARFWEGTSVGGIQLTPGTVLAVIFTFALGMIITRLLQRALKTTVLPRTKMDTGARNAVTSGIGYVGIALAAVIAITAGGIDLTALGFVLGALSVGIGFGLQNVVSNFVSGIILLIERPISEGDWIEVNGNMGIVKAISVRSTRIETFDRTDVIVPNADFISGTVTNWTRGNNIGRATIVVGVAYGNDTRRVQEILLEIARAHPDVAHFPEPGVDFLGFGADSLDFRIRAILRDVNTMLSVKTEIHHQIAESFAEEGIEIPFAQRDIWLRNPETLRDAVAPPSGAQPAEGPSSA